MVVVVFVFYVLDVRPGSLDSPSLAVRAALNRID